MFCRALGLGLLAVLVSSSVGCRMCCHPYDYCGPVYQGDGQCQSCCSGHARVGSVLDPASGRSLGQHEDGAPHRAKVQTPTPASSEGRAAPAEVPTPAPIKSQPPATMPNEARRQLNQQVQSERRPGDVPGSERIISVTERIVGPQAASAESEVAEASSAPSQQQSLPSSGWTARRSTDRRME